MEQHRLCGERIQIALAKRGIRQVELCEKTQIPKSAMSQYIKGRFEPKKERLLRMAEVLQVNPLWLMGYDAPMEPISHIQRGDLWVEHYGIDLGSMQAVPVLGAIRAGPPIVAEETLESFEFSEVTQPQDHFFLRVEGDSMIGAGILDGSLALIRKQHFAKNGQIIACLLDGETATLKRYQRQGDMVMLIAENPKYEPILLSIHDFESQDAVILGVLVEVKIKFY